MTNIQISATSPMCQQLNQLIASTQSVDKALRDQGKCVHKSSKNSADNFSHLLFKRD